MPSDLELHLANLRIVDTHEHLLTDKHWVENGPPDVLADLFCHYSQKDLISAGTPAEAIRKMSVAEGPLEERWREIEPYWRAIQFTGYGEAVRIVAADVYGMEQLSAEALRNAQPRLQKLRRPGERYRFLKDVCRYDHVQVNMFVFPAPVDEMDPAFFLHDLSWAGPANGRLPAEQSGLTGIEIRDLASLRRAIEAYFAAYAPLAIAVKTQHAYERTLKWVERSDADAERALAEVLKGGASEGAKLCLGDWCLARGVEQAIIYDLPVKIHTGYYWNNDVMRTERIRPGHLCPLFIRFPKARFVLMHAGYPYGHEIPALAKHFTNVYADLCWAWAMDPYMTMEVVRHFIHAAPITKLLAFGGDTGTPTNSYGFMKQMKRWFRRALEAEIASGDMAEPQTIEIATLALRENAMRCFDVAGRQAAIRKAHPAAAAPR